MRAQEDFDPVLGFNPFLYLKDRLTKELEEVERLRQRERTELWPKVFEWMNQLFDQPDDKSNISAKAKIASDLRRTHVGELPRESIAWMKEEIDVSAKSHVEVVAPPLTADELLEGARQALKAQDENAEWKRREMERRGVKVIEGEVIE